MVGLSSIFTSSCYENWRGPDPPPGTSGSIYAVKENRQTQYKDFSTFQGFFGSLTNFSFFFKKIEAVAHLSFSCNIGGCSASRKNFVYKSQRHRVLSLYEDDVCNIVEFHPEKVTAGKNDMDFISTGNKADYKAGTIAVPAAK